MADDLIKRGDAIEAIDRLYKSQLCLYSPMLRVAINNIPATQDLQTRVALWMKICFGAEISEDKIERNHRFLEESLELVQSLGCTQSEAHQLVDYVFNRPIGEPFQEVGGVIITLAALCLPNGLNMNEAGETEYERIMQPNIIEKIRAKQARKIKFSPLA